jgi:septal ring factor EnvC (AmiA/AmiB activator)
MSKNTWDNKENSKLQSKIAIQRTEIARLTQKLEALTKEKSELLRDIKWMRGERDE